MYQFMLFLFVTLTAGTIFAQSGQDSVKIVTQTDTVRLDTIEPRTSFQGLAVDPLIDLGGFVIDQTRTGVGHAFYEQFYKNWFVGDYKISDLVQLEEFPFQGTSTLLKIFFGQDQVYELPLQPNNIREIEELVDGVMLDLEWIIQERNTQEQQLKEESRKGNY